MASDLAAFPMLGVVLRAGGFGPGFAVRSLFSSKLRRAASSPVMCEDLGWFSVVICFIPRVFLVKSCTVLPG
jgi:hypothetical protein